MCERKKETEGRKRERETNTTCPFVYHCLPAGLPPLPTRNTNTHTNTHTQTQTHTLTHSQPTSYWNVPSKQTDSKVLQGLVKYTSSNHQFFQLAEGWSETPDGCAMTSVHRENILIASLTRIVTSQHHLTHHTGTISCAWEVCKPKIAQGRWWASLGGGRRENESVISN